MYPAQLCEDPVDAEVPWQMNGGLPVQSVPPGGPGWRRTWRRASRVPHEVRTRCWPLGGQLDPARAGGAPAGASDNRFVGTPPTWAPRTTASRRCDGMMNRVPANACCWPSHLRWSADPTGTRLRAESCPGHVNVDRGAVAASTDGQPTAR